MKGFILKAFIVLISIVSYSQFANAQCGFNNFNSGDLTPPGVGMSSSTTGGGGDGWSITVCAGAQYTATTCGTSSFDTYLTVFDAAGNAIGWNDDACGNQSTVTWTSTYSGTAWVFLDRWVNNGNQCDHSGTNQPISVTQNSGCITTPASNCASYIPGACGSSFTNQTTIGGGNDITTMSCHTDVSSNPISMPGGDVVYGITVAAGQTTIVVNMNNVVDGNDSYVELLFLGYSCSTTTCTNSIQYDIANGTFSNGSNTATFNITPTGGIVYFVVDAQSSDGIYDYDISFDCFASGIAFDSDGCGADADDGDMNGLRPRITNLQTGVASNTNLTLNGCDSYRLCERLYIENDNDWEWIDHVTFNLGSCFTNITNVAQPAGLYNGGTWVATTSAGAIDWEFNPSGGNLAYGDGDNGNYQCYPYTFCFDFTVGTGCTNGIDLVVGIVVTDDGIGGFGATTVGTDVEVEDNLVLGTVAPQAYAGINDTVCSTNPFTLSGAIGGSATSSTWTSSGTGTFSNAASLTSTYTPSAADVAAGQVTITLTTNDPAGNCTPATDQMILTIDPPAVISAGADQLACSLNPLNLSGTSTGAIVTTTWSTSGTGTFSNAASLTSTYTPSAADDAAGSVTLTLTSSDPNGLCGPTSDQMIITFDNTAPTITCPANQTSTTSAGSCTRSLAIPNPTVSDNCSYTLTWASTGATVLSGSGNVGTQTFNLGVTTITYTAVDPLGNSSTCSFTVTITDNINPTITSACPSNQTVAANASCQYVLPNYLATLTATDNCTAAGSLTITQSPAAGTTVGAGVTNVTLTVTDASGNSVTCNFTVTVTDQTNPTITSACPTNQTVAANASCQYVIPNFTAALTATDNCTAAGSIIRTQVPAAGTTVGTGVTNVTVTATDAAGNSATCNFTITVTDQTNPTITSACPTNQTVAANASCQYVIPNYTAALTVTDNCTAAGSIIRTQVPAAGTTVGTGVTNVTVTATDAAGNSATCNFTITVTDQTNPTITSVCPTNQTVAGNASCQYILPNYLATLTATDNCTAAGSLTMTQVPAAGTAITGSSPVTLTVTDAAGNSATCNFTITVQDNTNPTITSACPTNQTVNANASCQYTLPNYLATLTATDNCTAAGSLTITQSPAAGSVIGLGATPVTLTVTDAAGNSATCNFTVTVNDATAPTVTACPANQNLNIVAACNVALPNYGSTITVSDNCSPAGSITITQSPVAGTVVSGHGTVQPVTLTVTDAAGNISTCNFNVTTVDVVPPTITCPGNQTAAANASCQFTMISYVGLVTTSDNCAGVVSVTQSPAAGTLVSGTQTVTMTATDAAGNTSTCTFQVVVTDNTNPTITSACPTNQTVSANASCQYSVPNFTASLTATDNCTAAGSLTITQVPAAGTLIGLGVTPVVVTVADANGNTATCNFTITVNDNTVPTIVNCPSNQNLTITANCSVALPNFTSTLNVTDNCSPAGSITVTQSPVAGTVLSGNGTVQTVTLTATDAAGNVTTCSFNVTVVDGVNPTFTSCTPNQNETPNASCQFVLPDYTSLATVSDNCSITSNITITQSPAAGSTISGTSNVTLTATDEAGNTSTCVFQVILTDGTPPTITSGCPANQTVNADASCGFTMTDYTGSITVTDNCNLSAAITITQSPAVGAVLPIGTTTVTLTATDMNGNASTCTFDVTVVDNTVPTIVNCPSNQNLTITANCDVALPDFTSTLNVTDNCSPAGSITITQLPVAGTVLSGNGTVQTVTLTVTDAVGNTSTCSFDVTVVDGVNPTFVSCTPNQNENPDANCQFVLPDYTSLATLSDNCSNTSNITVTQSPAAGSTISGTSNVTLTATDEAGNTSTCVFQVILTDGTPPTITSGCPSNQTVNADASCGFTMTDFTGSITVTDNCNLSAAITITQSPAAGSVLAVGTTTVTLTATDMNGNSSNCTFDITVVDATAPIFAVCPSNQNLTITANCDATIPDYTSSATITDNCSAVGSITVTQSPIAGTVLSGNGTVQTITLTATDSDGNSSTCTFDITLVDGVAPTFVSCTPNQNEIPDANCQFTLPDYSSLASTTDNCVTSTVTVTQSPTAGTIITGTTTITLTATDQDGNAATCTFDVILQDGTPPVITSGCPANQTVNADASCGFTLTDFTGSITVTDNCNLSSSVTITQSPAAGTTLSVGTTTVTLTATDLNGNASTCTFDVTVSDVTAPTITCPADVISCDPVVTFTAPVGTDNCSGSTTLQTDATGLSSGSTFPVGTTTLTYTVTDASGNNVSCSFNITVVDVTTTPDAGADVSLCTTDAAATLNGTASSGGTLTWFSDAALTNPIGTGSSLVTSNTAGTIIYYLSEDVSGCNSNPDSVMVTYAVCDTLQIPTGFTPDGDGTNDVWDIPGLNTLFPDNTVQVYGRWGGLLFESTDHYATPWDGTYKGKELPVGSYYFVIDFGDGSEPKKGTVTIIE